MSNQALTNQENSIFMNDQNNSSIIDVNIMFSYVTYENHGTLKLKLEDWPELKGKDTSSISDWLNANQQNLFVDTTDGTLRPDRYFIYSAEELADITANGEAKEINEDVWPLAEYWNASECVSSRTKKEEKYLQA
jgi:hypothetical protein